MHLTVKQPPYLWTHAKYWPLDIKTGCRFIDQIRWLLELLSSYCKNYFSYMREFGATDAESESWWMIKAIFWYLVIIRVIMAMTSLIITTAEATNQMKTSTRSMSVQCSRQLSKQVYTSWAIHPLITSILISYCNIFVC